MPRMSSEERFWSKVEKTENCWNWTAAKVRTGYGVFTIKTSDPTRQQAAHRYSYELNIGPIPDGHEIDHMCHNRSCVNPGHLRPVTHKQNGENRAGLQSNNKSGVQGVQWRERTRRWKATVRHNDRVYYVGSFEDLEDAAAAVVAKRNELFTHNDLDRAA